MNEKLIGTWSTNNGNTWGEAITGKTVLGLKRELNNIIRGNLTGATDIGRGTIELYACNDDNCLGECLGIQAAWSLDYYDHIINDIK